MDRTSWKPKIYKTDETVDYKATEADQSEVNDYLDILRESGVTNMFGAGSYIEEEFGVDGQEARKLLQNWMENFGKASEFMTELEQMKHGAWNDDFDFNQSKLYVSTPAQKRQYQMQGIPTESNGEPKYSELYDDDLYAVQEIQESPIPDQVDVYDHDTFLPVKYDEIVPDDFSYRPSTWGESKANESDTFLPRSDPLFSDEEIVGGIRKHYDTVDYYQDDRPDFNNDPDFEGKINGVSVEPSQYTQSGMDHTDYSRGDIDTESKANEDDHKKSWDKLDSIAKMGFSDIGYDQKSWDSEPEEIRAEMEKVVKDNLGENWKEVANKIYREELNRGKKSGGESSYKNWTGGGAEKEIGKWIKSGVNQGKPAYGNYTNEEWEMVNQEEDATDSMHSSIGSSNREADYYPSRDIINNDIPAKNKGQSWQKGGEADPCWKGYKQIGMKDKNGKQVPNCVPESNESVLEKVHVDGWEFSVIDDGYGGGSFGSTPNAGLLEVGIFAPKSGSKTMIGDSAIKGWLTPEEVDDLKRTFEVDPVMAYRRIGGDWEEDWQKGFESKANEDFADDVIESNTECWKCNTDIPLGKKYCEMHCGHPADEFDSFTGKCIGCGKSLNVNMMMAMAESKEGLIDDIEKELLKFGINLDKDPDQIKEVKAKANEEGVNDWWDRVTTDGGDLDMQFRGTHFNELPLHQQNHYFNLYMEELGSDKYGNHMALYDTQPDSYSSSDLWKDDPSLGNKDQYYTGWKINEPTVDSFDHLEISALNGSTRDNDMMGFLVKTTESKANEDKYEPSEYDLFDDIVGQDNVPYLICKICKQRVNNEVNDWFTTRVNHLNIHGIQTFNDVSNWLHANESKASESEGEVGTCKLCGEKAFHERIDGGSIGNYYNSWNCRNCGGTWSVYKSSPHYVGESKASEVKSEKSANALLDKMDHDNNAYNIAQFLSNLYSPIRSDIDFERHDVEDAFGLSVREFANNGHISLDQAIDGIFKFAEINGYSEEYIEEEKAREYGFDNFDSYNYNSEWEDYTDEQKMNMLESAGAFASLYDTLGQDVNPDYYNLHPHIGIWELVRNDNFTSLEYKLPQNIIDDIKRQMDGGKNRMAEGFNQGLYGYVDAKCKTCGIEFDSIPDMDDHYAMNSDHISNLNDLDSDIPNSD